MPAKKQPTMPAKKQPIEREIRGTVQATNISPKGAVEGVLVKTESGMIQLNFPKHEPSTSAPAFSVGAKVCLRAKLETEEFEHPVYELSDAEASVEGVIARLNYARHGEINGFHLHDGTFVHLTPDVATEYDLRIGYRAAVTGKRKQGEAALVIDARSVVLSKTAPRVSASS
ncbi:MAG: hypothetical protein ABUL62_14600 [Myxococcales bacterium]